MSVYSSITVTCTDNGANFFPEKQAIAFVPYYHCTKAVSLNIYYYHVLAHRLLTNNFVFVVYNNIIATASVQKL